MHYIRTFWHHDNPDFPTVLMSEMDAERFETRKLEIYASGRLAWAGPGEAKGSDPQHVSTELGYVPLPPDAEIAANPEFTLEVIDAQEFAFHWAHRKWYDISLFPTRVPLAKYWRRLWDRTTDDSQWDDSIMCASYNNAEFYIDLGRVLRGEKYYLHVARHSLSEKLCEEYADTPEPLIALATLWSHRIADVHPPKPALDMPQPYDPPTDADAQGLTRDAQAMHIEELIQLLLRHGEMWWRSKFEGLVDRVHNEDVSVYDEILSFYGGMGSFNDLVIDAGNGHDVREQEIYPADMQLDVLRGEIASDARALKSGVF